MLLDSVLINFICNCVLCMHEFAFMYDYVYMSLCFILMSMHEVEISITHNISSSELLNRLLHKKHIQV
jgi:hypothetical protein